MVYLLRSENQYGQGIQKKEAAGEAGHVEMYFVNITQISE